MRRFSIRLLLASIAPTLPSGCLADLGSDAPATLDASAVARFLGDCPVVTSAGRTFPVEVRFAGKACRRWSTAG